MHSAGDRATEACQPANVSNWLLIARFRGGYYQDWVIIERSQPCDSIDPHFAAAWKHKTQGHHPNDVVRLLLIGKCQGHAYRAGDELGRHPTRCRIATCEQGKYTRTLAQNGVTAMNTVYEVSRPPEQWRHRNSMALRWILQ